MTAIKAAVRERPIIFGAESVRAILEGRKTQTRRVVKGLPPNISVAGGIPESDYQYFFTDFEQSITKRCPYGRPWPYCERLWVREAWNESFRRDPETRKLYRHHFIYRADMLETLAGLSIRVTAGKDVSGLRTQADLHIWKSPIHMPREASRLTLEITAVRVERLQDITPPDCKAEGIHLPDQVSQKDHVMAHIGRFMQGWDALNAKRGYSWDSNPWVWVIEFRKL